MAVNYEMINLERLLGEILEDVYENGLIAVMSFHSGEDSRVTKQMKQWAKQGLGELITKAPILPDKEEIKENSRSHSAKMRVFIKR